MKKFQIKSIFTNFYAVRKLPAVFVLCGLVLFCATPARAQIGILNSSNILHGTSVNLSIPFTVPSGAKVLVVEMVNRENSSGANLEPLTLTWNGSQSLVQAAEANNGATSFRDVTIYYLYNPTPGTGNVTGTATNVAGGITDTWLKAFTLTNVDTSVAPLAGVLGSAGANVLSLANTVSGVPANAWATVNSVVCSVGDTLGVNVPGGTQITTTDSADGSSTVTMGSVSGLATGANTFTATATGTAQKMALVEAIFLSPAPPTIVKQPEPQSLYSGGMVHFAVIASGATSYQWYSNNVALAGATNSALTYGSGSANVVAGTNYDVVVINNNGSVTSSIVTVSIRTPTEPFEAAVASLVPYTFYQLNETADPSTTAGGATAFDNANSLNGLYGATAQNGFNNNIIGPTSSTGFPGFTNSNTAFKPVFSDANSVVTLPSLNLNTNTVTIAAWINPASFQSANAGVVFCRGGSSVVGFGFGPTLFGSDFPLSYNWNNDPNTTSWNAGLIVPQSQWSLAVLTVTPTNATIYLLNANGIASARHDYPHVVQSFNGTTRIGGDPVAANRIFSGIIDDAAVFNKALTRSQIYAMFYAASGQTNYAPIIAVQPASATVYAGQTAAFGVIGGGSEPLSYQWQVDTGTGPTNINNGGQFSGATNSTLTINNATSANVGTYYVILSNIWNTVTSSGATLTVNPTGAATNITLSVQQPAGNDWNSSGLWNDGQGGLPASVSAAEFPGSTYELLAGSRLRTPTNSSSSTFPGNQLTVDGNGVWINNPGAGSLMAEIRVKEEALAVNTWTVNFPKLVMNGGQIDIAPDPVDVGYATIGGEMDVLTNAPIYNDSALGDNNGVYLSAWLTGGGTVEYHGNATSSIAFNNLTNNLNVTGTTNTFSGTWNIISGILLGSAPGSLGTNSIVIGTQTSTNAAMETSYDLNNTNANLVLYGKMYLHQNDAFKSVFVNGTPLAAGAYTIAMLNSNYPAIFPTNWALQNGSSVSTGSGQITVLASPAPFIVTQPQPVTVYPGQHPVTFSVLVAGNSPLIYRWFTNGTVALSDTANRNGSTSNIMTIPNPTAADAGSYTVVATNIFGAVTSSVAVLNVLPIGPATNETLNYGGTPVAQPAGSDWNTITNWIDGQSATISALSNPGSTYEVVVGSRLRTPAGTNNNIFPGGMLTIDGGGIFENDAGVDPVNVGEFRIKNNNNPSTNSFNNLVLSGGQIDIGDNTLAIIRGYLNVVSNSTIYVDSGAGLDRACEIDAQLGGSGDLFWHQFSGALGSADLQIAGTANTFTGQWIVDQGALVGVGAGSLGTNNIYVGTNGLTAALETLYDINNLNASLVLGANGRMFLHRNDHFAGVTINGTPLASGTYSFAALNSTYPANFPATWTLQTGSTVTAGSGQIIVGVGGTPSSPRITQISLSGTTLSISATNGFIGGTWMLLQSTNVALALSQWQTNLTGNFDGSGNLSTNISNTATNGQGFYILKVQ
jgi:hypothetical protein